MPKPLGLRICARALLLVALATCRGVYFALEQPQTSCMRFFPDFVALRVAIQKMFGCYWYEQFLSRPQKASTLLETADEDRCKRSINHLCSLLYIILEMSSFCSIFYTVEVPTRWLMDPLSTSQTKLNFLPQFHPVTWGPTAPWRWSRLGFGVQGSGLSPAPRSGSLREKWNNGNLGGRPFFTHFDLGAFWKQSLVIIDFPHEELYQKVPHQAVPEKAWTTEGQFQKGKSCCAEKEACKSKSVQDFPSWLEFVQQYFWIYNVFFHMVARDRNRFRVKDSRWLNLLVPSRLRSGGPGLKKTQVYPALYGERMCKFHKAHTDRDMVFNSVCCGGLFWVLCSFTL